MKLKIIFVLLFVFLGSYSVNGQTDIFKSQKETARRLDEMEGKSTPQRRENQESNRNSQSPAADNEALERWKQLFGENAAALKEEMDHFKTKETKCIFMIVIYLDSYYKLIEETKAAEECEKKSDLYGLQAAAIAASTNIIYCPENLYNMSVDEREAIYRDELVPIIENEDNDPLVADWIQKLEKVIEYTRDSSNSQYGGDMINRMCYRFSPAYIIPELLNIQQKIEALGCQD